jgi:hypothetical protein
LIANTAKHDGDGSFVLQIESLDTMGTVLLCCKSNHCVA